MSKCSFCQHENSSDATRCAKCQAWLIQSADVKPREEAPRQGDHASLPVSQPTEASEPIAVPVSQAFGLSPGDFAAVLQALAAGNKIEAIKRLRTATGMGLAEAKQAAESLERLGGVMKADDGQQPSIVISQADGVTTIARRQIVVGSETLTPELQELLRQVGSRPPKASGCAARAGVLLLAIVGVCTCAWLVG